MIARRLVAGALIAGGLFAVLWSAGRRDERPGAEGSRGFPEHVVPGPDAPVSFRHGGALLAAALIGAGLVTALLWTLADRAGLGAPTVEPKLTIEITGKEWWWQVRYLSEEPSRVFETANEIHVPVGEPVRLKLISDNVIHSFWVPAIAGKTDLIPGQTNLTVLEATKEGVYRGQCAEFCGLQHANMALMLVAVSKDDFAAWWDKQLEPAPAPGAPALAEGLSNFVVKCGACHSVRGTVAGGRLGPNLSHLMGRRTLAAGTLPNTPGHLAGWIADPQGIKRGSKMPRLDLTPAELTTIRTYLQTLK